MANRGARVSKLAGDQGKSDSVQAEQRAKVADPQVRGKLAGDQGKPSITKKNERRIERTGNDDGPDWRVVLS